MALIEIESSTDVYLRHYAEAERLLAEAYEPQWGEPSEAIAQAQVHATLAQAVAITRMVDSYNGWMDLRTGQGR